MNNVARCSSCSLSNLYKSICCYRVDKNCKENGIAAVGLWIICQTFEGEHSTIATQSSSGAKYIYRCRCRILLCFCDLPQIADRCTVEVGDINLSVTTSVAIIIVTGKISVRDESNDGTVCRQRW